MCRLHMQLHLTSKPVPSVSLSEEYGCGIVPLADIVPVADIFISKIH